MIVELCIIATCAAPPPKPTLFERLVSSARVAVVRVVRSSR